MKPVKLSMTAFGPYKNKEVVDFAKLENHRLFVVSGHTGAGKTTIFDAICFALYGEASGEERNDPHLLRSQFAEDGTHTCVELTFEIHGSSYHVFRQLPHVKEGNKTATGAQYELYILDGDQKQKVPAVDRFNVSDINEKIESILGLTKDQFSQIVMLPQGEFRKLLTSDTENKEEILRRIFKTGIYRNLVEKLKEERQTATEHYNGLTSERDLYMSQIHGVLPEREGSPIHQVLSQDHFNASQLLEALQVEAGHYHEETILNRQRLAKAVEAHKMKMTEYHRAESVNDKFRSFEDKQKKKKEMDQQLPQMKENEQRLEQAEKASGLEVYEQNLLDAKQEKAEREHTLKKAVLSEKQAGESLSKAKEIYVKEKAAEPERQQIDREIDRLKGFMPIVSELSDQQKRLVEMEAREQKESRELGALEQEIDKTKLMRKTFSEEIKKLETGLRDYPSQLKRLAELRDQTIVIRDFLRLRDAYANAEKSVVSKQQTYQTVQQNYEQSEKRWFDGQAGLLANHLHDGTPCPVCGSKEHPNKASSLEDIPGKDELDRLRKKKDDEQRSYITAKTEADSLAKQLAEKRSVLPAMQIPEERLDSAYEDMLMEGKKLRKATDQLEQDQQKLNEVKKRFDESDRQLEIQSQKLEQARKVRQERHLEFEKLQALHQQASEQIPESLRTLAQLKKSIQEKEEWKGKLKVRWEAAEQALREAEKEIAAAETNVSGARRQSVEAEEKLEKTLKRFEEQLASSGFENEQAYQNAKLKESDRLVLKQKIDDFQKELVYLEKQIKELALELNNASRQDLDKLRSEADQLEQELDQMREAFQISERLEKEAIGFKDKITAASEKAREAEMSLQIATDLYDAARGNNSKKISFERYIQIEFLEQITQAANQRLRRLSNGQFYLIRSERLERRGRQSGLGLDVYDAYTGQTRDVKSLSGGEKFNASLCLALGMADVIQEFEGGISIETMFIDEGFGSLDDESLNKAIDTLIELQKSGRLVGLISHVQELKNAIPAVLEVKKTKEGYSQTRFLLK